MNCRAHFYLLNDHFSQEYADEHNNGDESEMNRRYQWEDELEVNVDFSGIDVVENGTYLLQGTMPEGESFQHAIQHMRLFNVMQGDQCIAQFACSESTLDSFDLDQSDGAVLNVYLKGEEPLSNPLAGVYIAAQEFPKDLIF